MNNHGSGLESTAFYERTFVLLRRRFMARRGPPGGDAPALRFRSIAMKTPAFCVPHDRLRPAAPRSPPLSRAGPTPSFSGARPNEGHRTPRPNAHKRAPDAENPSRGAWTFSLESFSFELGAGDATSIDKSRQGRDGHYSEP